MYATTSSGKVAESSPARRPASSSWSSLRPRARVPPALDPSYPPTDAVAAKSLRVANVVIAAGNRRSGTAGAVRSASRSRACESTSSLQASLKKGEISSREPRASTA